MTVFGFFPRRLHHMFHKRVGFRHVECERWPGSGDSHRRVGSLVGHGDLQSAGVSLRFRPGEENL